MKFDFDSIVRLKSMLRKNIVHLFLLLLMTVALFTSILGVDFGNHWDEVKLINSVAHSVEDGILLPRWYNYPSLSYSLSLVALAPEASVIYSDIGYYFLDTGAQKKRNENLVNIVNSRLFKLRIRIIFIIVTYLSLFWIYFLVLTWRKSWIEALLASSLLGLSWEVAYHARWIAPDAILMQFGTLTMMCLFFDQNNPKARLWLKLSAIAAGLACGTKYPGGLLLVPVLLATYYNFKKSSTGKVTLYAFRGVLLIFVLIYLLTTPGTLLQPVKFIRDIGWEIRHYGFYGHGGHTIVPGIKHFLLLLSYFCMVVFSKYSVIACIIFIMALVGIVSLIKNEKKIAMVFLCFSLIYVVYMSCQKVMIARNYLVLIPFFAVLASRGCILLHRKLKHRFCRVLFSMFIVTSLLINASWLIRAANSIRIKNKVNYIEQLARYIDRRTDTLFWVSQPVADALLSFDKKVRSNVTRNFSDKAKAAVLYSFEICRERQCIANRFNYAWLWFGPDEVNFNYYPGWAGDSRIIVVSVNSALEIEGLR